MLRVTIVVELMLQRPTMAILLMQVLMLMRVQAQVGPAMRPAPGVATTVSFLTPMIAALTMRTGAGRPPWHNGAATMAKALARAGASVRLRNDLVRQNNRKERLSRCPFRVRMAVDRYVAPSCPRTSRPRARAWPRKSRTPPLSSGRSARILVGRPSRGVSTAVKSAMDMRNGSRSPGQQTSTGLDRSRDLDHPAMVMLDLDQA